MENHRPCLSSRSSNLILERRSRDGNVRVERLCVTALKFSSESWKWAAEAARTALLSWSRDAYACDLDSYHPTHQTPLRSSE